MYLALNKPNKIKGILRFTQQNIRRSNVKGKFDVI